MSIKKWIILLLIASTTLVSGCWDSIELNRRAVVSGLAIDLDQEAASDHEYQVSLQVIIADEISGRYSRGGSPVSVYEGRGRTIFEAVRNASRKVPRYLSLGHMNAVIVSEKLAREGIRDVFDFMERDAQIRTTSQVYVAKGEKAMDIVSVMTPIGKIPSSDLSQKTEASGLLLGNNFRVEIDDVIRGMQAAGGGPLINGVEIYGSLESASKKSNIEQIDTPAVLQLSGLGIFKEDKLIDWLDSEESNGAAWLMNRIKQTVLVAGCPKSDGLVSYNVIRTKSVVKAVVSDPEHPVIKVRVLPQATVKELNCAYDVRDSRNLQPLEEEIRAVIKSRMESAVRAAQKAKTDIFGFGEAVERANPKVWRTMKDRWADVFSRIKVEYEIDPIIRNTEMRDRSYQYNMNSSDKG